MVQRRNERGACGRLCRFAFFGIIIAAAGIGVGIYFGFLEGEDLGLPANFTDDLKDLPEDLWDYLPDIKIFQNEDPFADANPEDANKWKTEENNNGLELTLVNALDPQWHEFFDISVQEWENGDPDTLVLPTESDKPDFDCGPVTGVMKVCNGDYGEQDWKGINKVLLQNGWITTSMARMNDYFFVDGGDSAKRQYTMCHEIGHGFGLPHSDETFWNRDLGNCLDYTTRYEGNKSPDRSLYEFLEQLYGTVSADGTASQALRSPGNGRSLRENSRHLFEAAPVHRRAELLAKFNEIDSLVNQGQTRPEWRKLHENEHARAYEIDLGESYAARIHMLKP